MSDTKSTGSRYSTEHRTPSNLRQVYLQLALLSAVGNYLDFSGYGSFLSAKVSFMKVRLKGKCGQNMKKAIKTDLFIRDVSVYLFFQLGV